MRQNATLRRYRVADDDVVQHMSEVGKRRGVIRSRIYADDRVAAAVHQSVNDAGGNSFQIVGRMIWLQPNRHRARKSDRVTESSDNSAFPRGKNEILIAHELRHRRRHFRSDSRGKCGQGFRRRMVR
jgi:hypothetical protein